MANLLQLWCSVDRKVTASHSALPVALHRHEQYDGNGYLSGLVREQTPIIARVFVIIGALVSDRLSSKRYLEQRR